MAQVPQNSGYGSTWTIDTNGNVVPIVSDTTGASDFGGLDYIGGIQNGNDITSLVNSIVEKFQPSTMTQPNYPAGSFDVTPFKQFYDKAYEQLAPYYKQLLDEAGGDLKTALTNLETDYQTGKRTTVEDFQANMDKLGIAIPQEQTSLQGALNKRGIAVTETPGGGTTYAGGGRALTEQTMLNEDQALRKEAIDRTKQRGLEAAAFKKLTGQQTAQQGYRNITESQQAEHEQRATQLGSQFQAADQAQKSTDIAKAEQQARYGTSSGGRNVNPSDASSIKSVYKGYAGWNDPNAIIADYAATLGVGKE